MLEYEPGLYLAEGRYGIVSGHWLSILAEVHDREADQPTVILPTPGNAIQTFAVKSPERLVGTIEKGTRQGRVTAEKLAADARFSQAPHPSVLALDAPLREAVWTSGMSSMPTGRSSSTFPAPLPANLKIRPPLPSVPANRARFSGRRAGWACYFAGTLACDTRLAVVTIYGDRADIVYTFGHRDMQKPARVRTIGRFVGDELFVMFGDQNTANYRLRWDGNMQVILHLHGGGSDPTRIGVLTPEK